MITIKLEQLQKRHEYLVQETQRLGRLIENFMDTFNGQKLLLAEAGLTFEDYPVQDKKALEAFHQKKSRTIKIHKRMYKTFLEEKKAVEIMIRDFERMVDVYE